MSRLINDDYICSSTPRSVIKKLLVKKKYFFSLPPPPPKQNKKMETLLDHIKKTKACSCKTKITAHLCSGCYQMVYCGFECQEKNWPTHQLQCIGGSSDKRKREEEEEENTKVLTIEELNQIWPLLIPWLNVKDLKKNTVIG